MLPRRAIAFLVLALAGATTFARLGFWQLARLRERQAANAAVAGRLDLAPVAWTDLPADTASARFRRVRVTGAWDYDHELVLTARTRSGAPGVNLITPLQPDGGGTALLVNRGWVYAADGMTVDRPTWREEGPATVEGYVDTFPRGSGPAFLASGERVLRRLARDSVAARLPYPIAPVVVVQQLSRNAGDTIAHPFRVTPPRLDEGSHRSYALQWFAFAGITIVGAGVVLQRERRAPA